MRGTQNDLIKNHVRDIFTIVIALLILCEVSFLFFHYAVSYCVVNETDVDNTSFAGFLTNATIPERPCIYKTITILDKDYKQRSFRSDVYNVVYRTDGNISKTNDMDLYYSVEEGKQYNVSWNYGIEEVIEEA